MFVQQTQEATTIQFPVGLGEEGVCEPEERQANARHQCVVSRRVQVKGQTVANICGQVGKSGRALQE